MADLIQGKNIILYYHEAPSEAYPDGRDIAFACSTNCTFSVQADQKEVTSQTSAYYREYKIDIATWTISCDGIVTLDGYGYLNFLTIQQDRTPISIKFVIVCAFMFVCMYFCIFVCLYVCMYVCLYVM